MTDNIVNPYDSYINGFFARTLYLVHCGGYINSAIKSDLHHRISYLEVSSPVSASALVIGDWTGPTKISEHDLTIEGLHLPKGTPWKIQYHTGHTELDRVSDIETNVAVLSSHYYQYLYAQGYEAMSSFCKDMVWYTLSNDEFFKDQVFGKRKYWKKQKRDRTSIQSGESLLKMLSITYEKVLPELLLKPIWELLAECRHSIIHNVSRLEKKHVNKTSRHKHLFNALFNMEEASDDTITLVLDFRKLQRLMQTIAEFSFQIYKAHSIRYSYKWEHLLKG